MTRLWLPISVAAIAIGLAGCASANTPAGQHLVEAERLRAGLLGNRDARDPASARGGDWGRVPQAFAEADRLLSLAKDAAAKGDNASAELYGEAASAAYNGASISARLSRAKEEEAAANDALTRSNEDFRRYAVDRQRIDREASELERQLRVAKEAHGPKTSGPADPERERARWIATQTLVTEARLLCSAARLVTPDAPGLADAEAASTALERQLEQAASKARAPIDAAARARVDCLASLTKARRASTSAADSVDALLSEVSSAAVAGTRKIEVVPTRDERGVVVTLRSVFEGDRLNSDGEAALTDLGRVASAHPTFSVQVVVHDAEAPTAAQTTANGKRGDSVVRALGAGGAAAAKVKVELAGTKTPVVDPNDTHRRGRNARLDVVFVAAATASK